MSAVTIGHPVDRYASPVAITRPSDDPHLAAFCAALHPRLIGALTLSTGDRGLAEEVAQETLCRVCERWSSVRDMTSPEGWAFTVAFNLTRSLWRRATRGARALTVLQSRPDGGTAIPDVVEQQWVLDAVRSLPARQREVVALRFYADCSVAQTAAVMGCAEGTVKSLTSKAMRGLRTRLGPDSPLVGDPS